MEAVQRPLEHVHFVVDVVRLQGRLVLGPHRVDARVGVGVDDHHRRFDARHALGRSGRAVERHAGVHVAAQLDREAVGHAAAPAEPGRAEAAVGQRVPLEVARAVDHVLVELVGVEAALQGAAVVVVARIAPHRGQAVRGEGEEPGHRRAPRDVLDVRVQAAVLVDDQHRRKRPVAGRLHEIAAHLPRRAARRRVLDVGPRHPRVGERDGLRLRVARQQSLGHPEGRDAPDGHRRGAVEKLTPGDVAVAVLVVEVENARVDLPFRGLFLCHGVALLTAADMAAG